MSRPEPTEPALRLEMLRIGQVLYDRGLTVSNDGNFSARLDSDRILITPAGLCKGRLGDEDLLILRVSDGSVLESKSDNSPSSETNIHLETYRQFPTVGAIIHAHSPFVTALAITGTPFPDNVLPEVVLTLGEVPTTRLATPNTQDYLNAVTEAIAGHQAIVLNHHGAMTVGPDLETALIALERMEHSAHVYWLARLVGAVEPLSAAMVQELRAQRH